MSKKYSTLQRAHRLLLDHVSALPRSEQEVIRTYGLATFNKTRFNSHLEFLRRCLHFGVVPKGLVVKPTLTVSSNFFGRIQKVTQSYCKQLMRICIEDYSQKLIAEGEKLIRSKESLEMFDSDVKNFAKEKVHYLNKEVYDQFMSTKTKNLEALLPVGSSQKEKKDVVTIPSDLSAWTFQIFSAWTPSDIHPSIATFISRCDKDISRVRVGKQNVNLSKREYQAIDSLKKNNNIVIKKADKGGAVVVWRKDLYIAEGTRQLSNQEFHQELDCDNSKENNEKVKNLIKKEIQDGCLPPRASALIQEKPRCSRFYMLPKIHKVDNPGSPIVSTCNCPTECISSFIDDVLQPIVSCLPSFCKDSNDAIVKINQYKNNVLQNLFTMDVKSLYTIIPHSEGLIAMKYFLDLRTEKNPLTDTIVRLAELVLSLNTFTFHDKYYHQTKGVAMGTKMGPSFANLFMGYLEKHFFDSFTGPKPVFYLRYIDDILGLADLPVTDIENFIDSFGKFHPAVQFTHEISNTVNFLDIKLSIENRGVSTSVYYKPTDSHAYLHYHSNRSSSCKNAIPYSQFLRLCRLCSETDDFSAKSEEMCRFFYDKGYPLTVVSSALAKARSFLEIAYCPVLMLKNLSGKCLLF